MVGIRSSERLGEQRASGQHPKAPDRTVISHSYLHRQQLRHFVLFDILPFAGTLAAAASLFVLPLRLVDVALFLALWLATGLSLTVGFHRLFSHRAFATTAPVAVALIICGSMAGRGPMISWTAIHRRHHHLSDRDGDAHSPNLHPGGVAPRWRGWLHAHLTWMIRHDYPNPRHYVPDLLAQPLLVRVNARYRLWVLLGLAAPAVIGAAAQGGLNGELSEWLSGALGGLLWGGAVRLFVVEHSMSAINSLQHLFGARPFETGRDNSRNSPWLGLLAWGEGWHNNHHAFPYSAAFGLHWYQLDAGYWLIRLLQAFGLAWDVRLAPAPAAAVSAA